MTVSLVIDASFAFKLILPGAPQERLWKLMADWEQAGHNLAAPTLWRYEITSALSKTVHFGALTAAEGRQALNLAHQLNLQLIEPGDTLANLAFEWTLRLKRAAAYDCFYLALAETLQADFWTADKRLYQAAAVPWVHWVGD